MKKFLFTTLTATALVLSSCGDDDSDSVDLGLSGSVTFDGTTTNITDGLIVDFGQLGGDYNYDFRLSDGAITLSSTNISFDGSIVVYLELYNEGQTSFTTGTFTVGAASGNYCETASIETVGGDEEFATGGTVTVSGSGQTFTVTMDLEFANDRTLTGTVEGGFPIEGGFSFN